MKEKTAKPYEGFELWWHELQMSLKAFTITMKNIFILYVLFVLFLYNKKFSISHLWLDVKYLFAHFLLWIDKLLGKYFVFIPRPAEWHFDLSNYSLTLPQYVSVYHKYVLPKVKGFWLKSLLGLIPVEVLGIIIAMFIFKHRARKELHETKYIRGTSLVKPKELNSQLKKKFGKSRIKLTRHVSLPVKLENTHLFVLGATGTGKSTLIKSILTQLRDKDDCCIIFDLKGEYLSCFYNKAKDLILNPVDERCVPWSLFKDIKDVLEISDIARAFIPRHEGHNAYFYDAAKDVLASILEILWRKQEWSYEKLWELITAPPDQLLEFLLENSKLGGTIGAQHISKPSSAQTQGVMATLIEHCRVFRLLLGVKPEISLREWLKTAKSAWLFLPLPPQFTDLIAPLFTAVVNLLITEILSLPDYPGRRTWIILDELGNLLNIPKLSQLIAVGRSKEACVVIGTQTIAKLDNIYNPGVRKDLLNNCNVKILLRVNDPETARYCEELIGQQEFEERKKSYSLGVKDVRDGVSFTRQDITKAVMLASEFFHLPDLTCIVKIADLPPAKDEIVLKKFKSKVEALVKRKFQEFEVQKEQEDKQLSLKPVTDEKVKEKHSREFLEERQEKQHENKQEDKAPVPVDTSELEAEVEEKEEKEGIEYY